MKKLMLPGIALLLCLLFLPCRAEESKRVYVFGNFYFGMPIAEMRALDRDHAALNDADVERGLQQMTLISDNFVVTLWFEGMGDDAPLTEMDFAFYMPPDSLAMVNDRLQIQTSRFTVNAVYAYVERLCKKTFGPGEDVTGGALPLHPLLFENDENAPSLTRLREYSQPDGDRQDVILHLVAEGEYSVNYLICRQADETIIK